MMKLQKQKKCVGEICRILFGIVFVSVIFTIYVGHMKYYRPAQMALAFAAFLGAGLVVWGILHILPDGGKRVLSLQAAGDFLDRNFSAKEQKFQFWIILLLAFAPTYLAYFPGNLAYDSPAQLAIFFGELPMSSSNPLAHTYLLGSFVALGERLFQSANIGVAAFTLMQVLLTTNVLARTLVFFRERRVPFSATVVSLLWCIFSPTLHLLTVSCAKDILTGVFLVHFILNLIQAAEAGMEGKRGRLVYMDLAVAGILLCLMRNAGIFLVIAVLVILLLTSPRKQWKALAALGCVLVVVTVYSVICKNVLKIPTGEVRENFSVPIQQMAMVYRDKGLGLNVEMTGEQMEAMEEIIPLAGLANMVENDSADIAKSLFQEEVFAKDPGKYISLYFALGKQNPQIYKDAFRFLTLPYWDMNANNYKALCVSSPLMHLTHVDVRIDSHLAFYHDYLEEWIWGQDAYPVYISQPGIGIWIMVLVCGMAIIRKKKVMFLGALPIVVYFVGILFGPVALLRYLYPIMVATPALICMVFWDGEPARVEEPEKEEDGAEEIENLSEA